jgi:alpha-N-acetylglucosamine transferase
MSKKSYFSLINDESYFPGAVVMADTLLSKTEYPLRFIVSDISEAQKSTLRKIGASVVEEEKYSVETGVEKKFPSRGKTFSKILIWKYVNIDKGVFVDCDTMILQNPDGLFEKDEFSACGSREYFNTGVFVFEPEIKKYKELVEKSKNLRNYQDDSEQEMLQRYFKKKFEKIKSKYNYRPYKVPKKNILENKYASFLLKHIFPDRIAKIVHFIGYPKPWEIKVDEYERSKSEYTWQKESIKKAHYFIRLWYKKFKKCVKKYDLNNELLE